MTTRVAATTIATLLRGAAALAFAQERPAARPRRIVIAASRLLDGRGGVRENELPLWLIGGR